ncbi:transcription-repair coupling factor [Orrella sp. 11846]|uniref:transcription-repair coupling factor n=1 Tax=Orrella sp. 11846 TaxID=3409913 RepID=UPI003B595815
MSTVQSPASNTQQSLLNQITRIKSAQRLSIASPPGSGDAWLLTKVAQSLKPRTLVIVTADPLQAQRLAEEMALLQPDLHIRRLPDWETLPYDSFSPHQDLVSERLRTLHALMTREVDVLTVPATTAQYVLAPPSFLAAHTFTFRQGERLNEAALREQLVLANYDHVTQVMQAGQFSIRGGLVDLFPMGSAVPYRIDLFDDEIESIRAFDVDTQRSLYPVGDVQLLPGREFPMDEEARNLFRSRFREQFEGDPSKALPYRDIGNGIAFAGAEYYLPLFFEETATLFDYLPEESLIVLQGDVEGTMQKFLTDTQSRYQFLNADRERPVLPPQSLFLKTDQVFEQLKPYARLTLNLQGEAQGQSQGEAAGFDSAPNVAIQRKADDPLRLLRQALEKYQSYTTVLCADSAGRRETLVDLLAEYGLNADDQAQTLTQAIETQGGFEVVIAPMSGGFVSHDDAFVLLTENDLYPEHVSSRRRKRAATQSDPQLMIRDLAELRVGDPVVHTEHGVGRYMGLIDMDLGEGILEFLHLTYANDTTLYVPVSQLEVITRYSGADPENAPLHQLGSGQWDKARRKAAEQVRDTAAELLELYAQRAARQGHVFAVPEDDYEIFADEFGFEETPDQAAAIAAVLEDMASTRPMDRLVCGDVGFGKTEVALRAAFVAVANNQQVALLCPTTLLAEQHAQTFADRFAQWPVKIAELSRMRTTKEVRAAVEGVVDGSVDIVIGTHKLLSKSMQFKRLGLVIIDEEHRFGVRQKETLKALRAQVDVLTLTATPIPRTLSMSLDGIRDFSVIATAPEKRLAIKTFVRREDNSTIREAMLRELRRGGQVYFLHNEVSTIQNRMLKLQELIPEARIGIAHGQMNERELEQVMRGFYQQRYNVLLCTTIIETGIDVPTANTIIMHRADRFGLAQLHQLRGRVGRSHHQAYAYLLTPGEDALTRQAKKRLEAISAMEELGSGFFLAMHDLEIRGTGEILGDSQSGNIHEVGFSLYNDMLQQAVRALRDGREPSLDSAFDTGCEIKLHTPALLPKDFCPDVNARLNLYKRLSGAQSEDDVIVLQEEMIDRFGKLPEPAKALITLHKLRVIAQPLGIRKIDASDEQILFQFKQDTQVDPVRLIEIIQSRKDTKFAGPDRLKTELITKTLQERAQVIAKLLREMSS